MTTEPHVTLTITADSVSPARAGFGIPLIVSHNASFAERVRIYTRVADIVSDGFAASSPEVLAAGKMFGQNPRPTSVMIGRAAGSVTQVYEIGVVQVIEPDHVYQLSVAGEGVTSTLVEYESQSADTNDDIVDGLVIALNAVAGKNYTAAATGTPGSEVVTVTGTAAGDWFSVETVTPADLTSLQSHGDPGTSVADDLAAILLENDQWYWLYTLYNSEDYVSAAAVWAQANRKLYVADSNDSRDLGTSTGTAGTLDVLAAAGYTYVAGDYHPSPVDFAGAALIGNIAPRTPGSWTALGKRRAGVTPVKLTPTQITNLNARNANYYITKAGVNITVEGTTAVGPSDLRGFIDNVVSLDALEDDAKKSIFGTIMGAAKIPRTDAGMVQLQNALSGALQRGVASGIIAELSEDDDGGPSPLIEVPLISEMDDLLPRGVRMSFSFKLAGAVHSSIVTGVVIL